MDSGNDVEQPSGIRKKPAGITPSAAKLKRILGASSGCRDLMPYEIELLRRAKQEIAQVANEVLAEKDKH